MDDKIVSLAVPGKDTHLSGFTTAQFKKIDGLFLMAASRKAINHRTVECDFEAGTATYTYYKNEGQQPLLSFVIQRVGPRTLMYEIYQQGKGRIAKSGLFETAYDRLQDEIQNLIEISP
ncbi:MAG: hypothetical protein LRY54_01740 [Alphaproteobacteria bacterium]|nr:hypothetical protein [Alphaproteobacteria bacterium]MCD8562791.1 hypothetical protein [Alphaproteobacteria bacterium]